MMTSDLLWRHAVPPESPGASSASLSPGDGLPPHERRLLLSLFEAGEVPHIDELIEKLETENVFLEDLRRAARFRTERRGKAYAGGRISLRAFEGSRQSALSEKRKGSRIAEI